MTEPIWYDVTIKRSEITQDALIGAFKKYKADQFVIGKETGAEGYEHWQCRVKFKKPTSWDRLMKFNMEYFLTGHWTKTHVKDFEYCEKEGEFYRSWEGPLAKYREMQYNVWELGAIDVLKNQDDRQVCCIIDEKGSQGKTTFGKMLVVKEHYAKCPIMRDAKDYLRFAYAHSEAKGFIFDIPRAGGDNADMWSAIETIKDGYAYDDRYQWKEVYFDPPKIIVFTNDAPSEDMLSKDRWRKFYIHKYFGLVDWNDRDLEGETP